jgi:hypothetical protein
MRRRGFYAISLDANKVLVCATRDCAALATSDRGSDWRTDRVR